jgi:hypothetical protein
MEPSSHSIRYLEMLGGHPLELDWALLSLDKSGSMFASGLANTSIRTLLHPNLNR